eukprot:1204370-Pyramimonas_sp.AAC.1
MQSLLRLQQARGQLARGLRPGGAGEHRLQAGLGLIEPLPRPEEPLRGAQVLLEAELQEAVRLVQHQQRNGPELTPAADEFTLKADEFILKADEFILKADEFILKACEL